MYQQSTQPCSDCQGQGVVVDEKDKCKKCNGKKVLEQKTQLEVALEPGCPHEHSYIFHGMADEHPGYKSITFFNSSQFTIKSILIFEGIMAGDIHVRIMVDKHKEFTRQGADLFTDKKISLLEALTGTNYSIKGLDGK